MIMKDILKCMLCGKTFLLDETDFNLTQHIDETHAGEDFIIPVDSSLGDKIGDNQ